MRKFRRPTPHNAGHDKQNDGERISKHANMVVVERPPYQILTREIPSRRGIIHILSCRLLNLQKQYPNNTEDNA